MKKKLKQKKKEKTKYDALDTQHRVIMQQNNLHSSFSTSQYFSLTFSNA